MLFKKSLLGAAAVLMLSTGAAMAVPTATVDGITIPIDSASGGSEPASATTERGGRA